MSLAAWRAGLTRLAVGCALLAGFLLLGAVAVTTASVARGAFGQPILGDSEVVEMLLGAAIAFCMPLCEMKGAHVLVDFFTQKLPARGLAGLDAVMRAIAALVVAVLAWRLAIGGYNMWDRERETMFLLLPFWWGYAAAALGMTAWSLCAAFVATESLARARRAA
ncbi:TRAP transporter small permease [Falsiroseomonas selenitidurans]|uniref:TRAP transporter small permease protein n=1 Tax=Falsiroseomonas selenitidurans TaxID=2716335 RepID=A0ABX1E0A7_9PROT|nr:TRAP transporter small permease subunit [Falsiroseomonas selenitidurans]NKC30075.1 TRAP transporter small permease [Falsiroseomonas selenitidurans]